MTSKRFLPGWPHRADDSLVQFMTANVKKILASTTCIATNWKKICDECRLEEPNSQKGIILYNLNSCPKLMLRQHTMTKASNVWAF